MGRWCLTNNFSLNFSFSAKSAAVKESRHQPRGMWPVKRRSHACLPRRRPGGIHRHAVCSSNIIFDKQSPAFWSFNGFDKVFTLFQMRGYQTDKRKEQHSVTPMGCTTSQNVDGTQLHRWQALILHTNNRYKCTENRDGCIEEHLGPTGWENRTNPLENVTENRFRKQKSQQNEG